MRNYHKNVFPSEVFEHLQINADLFIFFFIEMIFKVNPQSNNHTGGEIKQQLKVVSLDITEMGGFTTSINTALCDIQQDGNQKTFPAPPCKF